MKIKTQDKNTRIRYGTYLKFKLENRDTRATLSNGHRLSLLLHLNVLLTWF